MWNDRNCVRSFLVACWHPILPDKKIRNTFTCSHRSPLNRFCRSLTSSCFALKARHGIIKQNFARKPDRATMKKQMHHLLSCTTSVLERHACTPKKQFRNTTLNHCCSHEMMLVTCQVRGRCGASPHHGPCQPSVPKQAGRH